MLGVVFVVCVFVLSSVVDVVEWFMMLPEVRGTAALKEPFPEPSAGAPSTC